MSSSPNSSRTQANKKKNADQDIPEAASTIRSLVRNAQRAKVGQPKPGLFQRYLGSRHPAQLSKSDANATVQNAAPTAVGTTLADLPDHVLQQGILSRLAPQNAAEFCATSRRHASFNVQSSHMQQPSDVLENMHDHFECEQLSHPGSRYELSVIDHYGFDDLIHMKVDGDESSLWVRDRIGDSLADEGTLYLRRLDMQRRHPFELVNKPLISSRRPKLVVSVFGVMGDGDDYDNVWDATVDESGKVVRYNGPPKHMVDLAIELHGALRKKWNVALSDPRPLPSGLRQALAEQTSAAPQVIPQQQPAHWREQYVNANTAISLVKQGKNPQLMGMITGNDAPNVDEYLNAHNAHGGRLRKVVPSSATRTKPKQTKAQRQTKVQSKSMVRTADKVQTPAGPRCVYVGARGARYVKVDGAFRRLQRLGM